MSGDVVNLGCITYLDLPPDRILDAAKGELESVIIVGFDQEGGEYFASSVADGADALWILERAKRALLSVPDEEV